MEGIFSKFFSVLRDVTDETPAAKEATDTQSNGIVEADEGTDGVTDKVTDDDSTETPQSNCQTRGVKSEASEGENSYDVVAASSVAVEQCVDVVPVEGLPDSPPPSTFPLPEYVPSLHHSPSQGVLQRHPSPSLFDKSIEFIKREFDSLRYSLGTRPMLTHHQWFTLFNTDGQMLQTDQFYCYLLEYDWPSELLQEGWKYMFEFYETFSNHEERVLVDKTKEIELDVLLQSWSSLLEHENSTSSGKARVEKLIYLINKDVPRTDRDHPFYMSSPENSEILRDLLVTFCFANPDIGYVQGMNEVLSMFLITVDDKVAAYWSFSNYLLKNRLFFNSTGLMAKLNGVAELLNIHDPELYSKLKSLDCSNMLFCQRWILLGFKRESKSFDMAVKIFTMINCLKPTHYIQLQGLGRCELLSLDMFLVVALLICSRATLLSYTDQTDVYQWTGRLKLADMSAICHAKQMYEEWARWN